MKASTLVFTTLVPCLSVAQNELTITDENSSLRFTIDPPIYNLGSPSDPTRLPRQMTWTVNGRAIAVYASSPWSVIDVEHFHVDAHVGADQLHAQGPMVTYATSPLDGTVTGGAVYTVAGDAAGGARIVEKVDINNKTRANLPVQLTGMGFKPPSLPEPDYSSLEVTGTTTIFYQGNDAKYSITDFLPAAPFPPSVVLPIVSFVGFNPLFNQDLMVPPGAVLTMITELNVKPEVETVPLKAPLHALDKIRDALEKLERRLNKFGDRSSDHGSGR